ITAFLLLSQRDNVILKQILQDPHHPAYLPLLDELLHNPHSGVVRLLLGFLDDARAPSCAISVLVRRHDTKFVRNLLRKIGFNPSSAAAANLKRIDAIGWLGPGNGLIDGLNDAEQHSLVQLILATSMKRLEAFKTIDYLIRYGKPGGRAAAAEALAQFGGAEANALALVALESGDPAMQAAIVPQLRQRGIPGALSRLVEQLDSPHEVVRQAARKSLGEFSVERFLAAYDLLDDDVRRTTATLVRKIDPGAINTLAEELRSPSRTRRLRALGAAGAGGTIVELEARVLKLLSDTDHVVRTEAARALAACDTPASRRALREALLDRSVSVQEAAEQSLRHLTEGNAKQEEQTA
ncbi:MAG TPA: HEAT repeat domain-containing protein, partial [Pirellulales bacterium]|nr:HEAT repeat domain-containing protein [Pirellulales bacterium]